MAFDSRERDDVPCRGRGEARGRGGGFAAAESGKGTKNQARIVPVRRPPFNRTIRAERGKTPPQRFEIGAQRRVVMRVGAFARDQQDVDRRQVRADFAEALARDALDAVAPHGVRRDAARDRKAEPRDVGRAVGCLCVEVTCADALAGAAQAQEISGSGDAGRVREASAAHRGRRA